MNSLKVTIISTTLLLILLLTLTFQLVSHHRSAYSFTCRSNISMFNKERRFTGSIQFAVNKGKGAIMLMGVYTDERGDRHLASIHNELSHFSRHGNLYSLRFAKATVVPHSLTTNSTLMNMFHPFLFNGENGKMFYHIFTQPSGNKVTGFGKIPEMTCRTSD